MRKRSKYRPGPVLHMPTSWGMTQATINDLSTRDEQALDAILAGEGAEPHLGQLEGSCSAAHHAVNYAQANPGKHTLDPACLGPVRSALLDCAAALLCMRQRFRDAGKVGCSGLEREALKDLVAHLHTLRAPGALPRRVWWAGTQMAYDGKPVPVPRELAKQHLGVE